MQIDSSVFEPDRTDNFGGCDFNIISVELDKASRVMLSPALCHEIIFIELFIMNIVYSFPNQILFFFRNHGLKGSLWQDNNKHVLLCFSLWIECLLWMYNNFYGSKTHASEHELCQWKKISLCAFLMFFIRQNRNKFNLPHKNLKNLFSLLYKG